MDTECARVTDARVSDGSTIRLVARNSEIENLPEGIGYDGRAL